MRFHEEDITTDKAVEDVAKIWNNKHMLRIEEGEGMGLGGLIRAGHVRMLMRKAGYRVKIAQMETTARWEAEAAPSPMRKVLKGKDIDGLSHKDCEPWLAKIGVPLGRAMRPLAARRATLKKHFEGKPETYALQL